MKIAVLGYGNIGNGVVRIVDELSAELKARAGEKIEVKYVLDLRDFPGDPYESLLTHDVNDILNDPEVTLVVETMGGTGAAYKFVKAALEVGKSAVSSNKALVAKYGSELLAIAREKKINFQFEASVGGAIPIIRPLYACMTGTRINKIAGIMNGTTNYMLTKMDKEGLDYAEVLKEAQRLGYAEADPTADVEGFDTCRKIAILSSIACGKFVDFEDIPTTGITNVTKEDISLAKEFGMSIKLIGYSDFTDEGIVSEVAPKLVAPESPLYAVSDVFNAIMVSGDMSGDLMFYGSGAGKLPTASAVVADIVECAKNAGRTVYEGWADEKVSLVSPKSRESRFFVRFDASLAAKAGIDVKICGGSAAFITGPTTYDACEAKYKDLSPVIIGLL